MNMTMKSVQKIYIIPETKLIALQGVRSVMDEDFATGVSTSTGHNDVGGGGAPIRIVPAGKLYS